MDSTMDANLGPMGSRPNPNAINHSIEHLLSLQKPGRVTKVIRVAKISEILKSLPMDAEDRAIYYFIKSHNTKTFITVGPNKYRVLLPLEASPIERGWHDRDQCFVYVFNPQHPYFKELEKACLHDRSSEQNHVPVANKNVYSLAARRVERNISLKRFEEILNFKARTPEEWEICAFAKNHETRCSIMDALRNFGYLSYIPNFSFAVERIRMVEKRIFYIVNLDHVNMKFDFRNSSKILKEFGGLTGDMITIDGGLELVDKTPRAPSHPKRVIKIITLEKFQRILVVGASNPEEQAIAEFARSHEYKEPILVALRGRSELTRLPSFPCAVEKLWIEGERIGYIINFGHPKMQDFPPCPLPVSQLVAVAGF
ncbi:unnamed protein product [Caenorhabditis brenneri]